MAGGAVRVGPGKRPAAEIGKRLLGSLGAHNDHRVIVSSNFQIGARRDRHDHLAGDTARQRVSCWAKIVELGLIVAQRLDRGGVVGGAEDAETRAKRLGEVAREGLEAGQDIALVL